MACDVETGKKTIQLLTNRDASTVYDLSALLATPVAGSGYKAEYGLLGRNLADKERIKLLRVTRSVDEVSSQLRAATGKQIKVMVMEMAGKDLRRCTALVT